MTPDDVAAMLNITRVQVIRQSRAGKLPAIHIGKCYRYRLESLQAWLDKQEHAASATFGVLASGARGVYSSLEDE